MAMEVHYSLIILLASFISNIKCQDVGSSCKDRYTNQPGICRLPEDCPGIEEKASRGITPTICAFKSNTIPIVCCEGSSLASKPSISPSSSFSPSSSTSSIPSSSPPSFSVPSSSTSRPPQPNDNTLFFPEQFEHSPLGPPIFFPQENQPSTLSHLRKSEQKCHEYSKFTVDSVVILPLVTDPNPTSVNVSKCDYDGVPLIVGGKPAAAGEFPFMAAVGFPDKTFKCGGTLISEQFVLTAAHCTRTRVGSPDKVRLGALNLQRVDGGANPIDVKVSGIVIHPDYKPPKKYNDIAVLKLEAVLTFSKFIRPACLWSSVRIKQRKGIATGWGKTSFGGESSEFLLKVALDLLDNSVCGKTFGVEKNSLPSGILGSMLCAGELKGNKDTCQGDSGGPLVVTQDDNNCLHYIVGVTSFGRSCGAPNTPAIYTRVSEFVDWIETTIWP